jgi:multiple sugar transport system permease protein
MLPTISPVILFAVVLGVIEGMQYFTQAYVAANVAGGSASYSAEAANALGYPEDSTLFYPVLLYQQGFRYFNMGYASALAMMLLCGVLRGHVHHRQNSRRFVHYQGPGR